MSSQPDITVRWLGTNAWELAFEGRTILIDPWVTRFETGAPKGPDWNRQAPLVVDEAAVDAHVGSADCVLVTHGHWDHITDIPYIAARTGATVLGTETHLNLLRAMDAPEDQLAQVEGGEHYRFDGFSVEVFPALHNPSGRHKNLLFPGTIPGEPPKRPEVVEDLVEGGSLAYNITIGEMSFFIGCSANFQARNFSGIDPTVLFMLAAGNRESDYEARLLETMGYPPYVIPTHWDDYEEPLTEPAVDWLGASALGEKVAELSPETEFILLDHLESHTFTA